MTREYTKTLTYLTIHLTIGFSVAYLLTGSIHVAGGIALIEPCVNAVAFFFHERAWQGRLSLPAVFRDRLEACR